MKTVYLFDAVTGEYLGDDKGIYEAQESPLEPGEYITPECSTELKMLLPHKDGFARCFLEGAWQYKIDNRGLWFKPDRQPVEIFEIDGNVESDWTREPAPPTIAEIKAAKLIEINNSFSLAMGSIVNGTPPNELSSWGKQESEARAYLADNNAITPLIDALSSARSVPKDELVSRIITKADLFANVSGTFIGRRQGLEDDLDALPEDATPEAIAAISW